MNEQDLNKMSVKEMDVFPERSEWACYLFGNRPGRHGMIYYPKKGLEPNWFVRWMMRICFDCLWVKEK